MKDIVKQLDAVVDDYARTNRFMTEPLTPGRARAFVIQHRLTNRYRNSVLKLRVAANIPDWDLRLRVIKASAQEIIADDEFAQGRPHWAVLEQLGRDVGLSDERIRGAAPSESTQLAWLAWEALMSNRHWLEGLVANTCAERATLPGYGSGLLRERGWTGLEHHRWGQLFALSEPQLEFWSLHAEADIEHSNLGWQAVAEYAERLRMEEAVVEACRLNLLVWKHYLEGIASTGDADGD